MFPGNMVRVSCGETATLQRSRWLAACLLLRATAIRTVLLELHLGILLPYNVFPHGRMPLLSQHLVLESR